jgi:hypothetical protein
MTGQYTAEHDQQRHQRHRDRQHGIREHQREPVSREGIRARPTIMDSVPQTPDQQIRNAITSRIIADVTAG